MDNAQPNAYEPLSFNIANNAPVRGPTDWQLSEQRLARERSAHLTDYIGSMWRQDSLVDGLVANYAGSQMKPQPGYFAGSDTKEWADLTNGLWEDNHQYLYSAVSPAHAMFIKDRLLQKQEDMVRLGDLGIPGIVGRAALNIVSPDQLLVSMSGGWVARGAAVLDAVKATSLTKAALASQAAAKEGTARAVAAGIGFSAAENMAFEKMRQSVNFEDSTPEVLHAGLVGAGLSTPFALAGAKTARRIAKATESETEVLRVLKKHEDGGELTPAEMRTVHDVAQTHEAIRDVESGRITPEEFNQRMDAFHGPIESDEAWARRNAARLRNEADAFISENFPNAGKPLPAREKAAPGDMPASHAEIDASNLANPPQETAMQSAFKRALVEREKLRKAFDLDSMDAATAKAKKAEWGAAFKQAEAQRDAAIAADHERMLLARERADALGTEDPYIKAHEQAQAAAANPQPPAPVQPPAAHPHERFVGQEVSWAGRDGATVEGTVARYNPEIGKLIVETNDGMKAVPAEKLDQWDGGPTTAGFLPGSIGAAQVSKIAHISNQRTAMAKARMDFYAILNGSEHDGVRRLAYDLIKDAIQNDDYAAQGWTASEYKKQIQRTVGGRFHFKLEQALKEANKLAGVGMLERGKFKEKFMELVTRETRGDPSVKLEHPDIYPAVAKASKEMKDSYASLLEQAKQAGVKGAQDVAPNDLYVNRKWNHSKIREAINTHGEDAVINLLAHAIQVPGHTGNKVKAKRFLKTVIRLEYSPALQNIHMQGRDLPTLRGELKGHGLDDHAIDDLIDVMFDARDANVSDAGRAGNLKFRFALDENAAQQLPTGKLHMADLLENDARVVMDSYINSISGHIGLARKGIDSNAAWRARIKEIEDEARMGGDGNKLGKELKLLEDIYAHITGRPMSTSDFSASARWAAGLRALTRSAMLGQLGLTAAFELNRAMSLVGFKAMLQSMPSLRDWLTALRQGHVPDAGLAQNIMDFTGFGYEKSASFYRKRDMESGFADGMLVRFENMANKLSHVTDVISGNASFTSITRHMAAMGATRQAFEIAMGRQKLTDAMRKRWVGQGMDSGHIDEVLAHLKEHSDIHDGHLEGIRFEEWMKNEPESCEAFQLFLSRQTRDAIQDHDIGETMPFMHTTLGKVMGELRTFMLVGHAKNFLKQFHYRDSQALSMYAISMVAESMAYSMQAAMNYPDKLDEMLTPERIAKAAFARSASNGMTPMLIEAGHVMLTGGDGFFQEGSTANTDNRAPWKTPSYIMASRLMNAAPDLVGGVLGTGTVTQSEFRDGARALPLSRLYGAPLLINYFADMFPKSGPKGDD